jgi:hypothetical protein
MLTGWHKREQEMGFYSLIATAILSVLSFHASAQGGLSSESLTARGLSTEEGRGDFPVCFNGAGDLLPCADGVEPPPVGDSYLGAWTGRMTYDRRSTGACYDADVSFSVSSYSTSLNQIDLLIVIRDSGGLDNVGRIGYLTVETGTSASYFYMFGTQTDYSLQFNSQGFAQGYWNYSNGDCYGDWIFTKE